MPPTAFFERFNYDDKIHTDENERNQWRNYRGSSYNHAAGPGRVGGPGSTKNTNIVSEKCELNNNINIETTGFFFCNALNQHLSLM